MIVRLMEDFLQETHLHSAWTCGSVRLREVSVLRDVHLKRFHCTTIFDRLLDLFLHDGSDEITRSP